MSTITLKSRDLGPYIVLESRTTAHPDDVFVWPDGFWCFREEHSDDDSLSDDFEVLRVDTPEYDEFLIEQEY